MHYIRDIVLERLVPEAVSDLSDFVRCYEPVFLYLLAKKNNAMRQKEYQQLQQAVEDGTKRIAEIDKLIEKVFEQNAGGILSNERFAKMLQNYEKEQKALTQEVEENRQTLQNAEHRVMDLRITARKKNIKNPPQTSKRSLREDLKYDNIAHQNIVFLLSGLALFFDYLENKNSFTISANFSAFDNTAG